MHRSFSRSAVLAVAVLGLTLATAVATAPPAAAHVTVNADTAEQGGYAALAFRVPNERDNAATSTLEVAFPREHPVANVSVKPHPGWSHRVEMATLDKPIDTGHGQVSEVVSRIVWTADSRQHTIKPGEYDEFSISAGPLPQVTEMVFKALQTYDSGEVVRWIETAPPGAAEPEYPAPVLQLAPGGGEQEGTPVAARTAASARADSPGWTALGLSIAALVVGLGAGVVAGLAWRRTRR